MAALVRLALDQLYLFFRLKRDLLCGFDARASPNFVLQKDALVHVYGVGGRTVPKLVKFDLSLS